MVTEVGSAFEVIGEAVANLAASVADSKDSMANVAASVAVLPVDTIEEVSVAVAVVEMILDSEIIYCHSSL